MSAMNMLYSSAVFVFLFSAITSTTNETLNWLQIMRQILVKYPGYE